MKREHFESMESDQILMAMASHDLRKIMLALDKVLEVYLDGLGNKSAYGVEIQDITRRTIEMRHTGKCLLACIDEILAALDKTSPVTRHVTEVIQFIDKSRPAVPAMISCAMTGRSADNISGQLPYFWQM